MGYVRPDEIATITVPCAGSVSPVDLLNVFNQGAAGILVLACHADNCFSHVSNQYAQRRIARMNETIPQMGIRSERLEIRTIAANMGYEYVQWLNQFRAKIRSPE
jgi:coenzyme F420-reducing hydrogenase delta subunit